MLDNRAVPRYYGQFREDVLRGKQIVNENIALQMNLIDDLIDDPAYYYDEDAVEGFQKVKTVYPFGKAVKFGFQFHTALVAGEVVVAVSALEIEADSPVVLPVLLIVVFNRIIHLLCLPVHAVRADESSTAEDVEDFFG